MNMNGMIDKLGATRKLRADKFPEEWVCKSSNQIQLEENGCRFAGQEALANHELDNTKSCYCGRPNKATNTPTKEL
jgi:hypothetical protein